MHKLCRLFLGVVIALPFYGKSQDGILIKSVQYDDLKKMTNAIVLNIEKDMQFFVQSKKTINQSDSSFFIHALLHVNNAGRIDSVILVNYGVDVSIDSIIYGSIYRSSFGFSFEKNRRNKVLSYKFLFFICPADADFNSLKSTYSIRVNEEALYNTKKYEDCENVIVLPLIPIKLMITPRIF
ncbi:MAG: hypothetical protein QM610_06590 [Chitinophagaceae bacterium]